MNLDPNHQGAALSLLQLYEKELIEFKNVVEFLALFSGNKMVMRLVLTSEQAHEVATALHLYFPEIVLGSSQYVLEEVFRSSQWDSFQERRYKAVGEDGDVRAHFFGQRQFVELAIEAEDDKADAFKLGELFGIPRCCARQYHETLNASGEWMPNYIHSSQAISSVDAVANRFSSIVGYQMGFHNDYFPCSFDCEKTLEISRANRGRLSLYGLDALVELAESNSVGAAIALDDHVFYRAGESFRDKLLSGETVSTNGFEALTPCAPNLPPAIAFGDSKIQAVDYLEGGSFTHLSICFFEPQRDRL